MTVLEAVAPAIPKTIGGVNTRPASSLSDAEIEEIRKLYADLSVPTKEIYRAYNLDLSEFYRLIKREKWPMRLKASTYRKRYGKARNGPVIVSHSPAPLRVPEPEPEPIAAAVVVEAKKPAARKLTTLRRARRSFSSLSEAELAQLKEMYLTNDRMNVQAICEVFNLNHKNMALFANAQGWPNRQSTKMRAQTRVRPPQPKAPYQAPVERVTLPPELPVPVTQVVTTAPPVGEKKFTLVAVVAETAILTITARNFSEALQKAQNVEGLVSIESLSIAQ